ncbi:MAG: hypothetical protein HY901_26185 [Deltaproteobacteria bacterium]|nr:hypothetical protein [Deltaproteobacteria bacterium]
MDAPLRAKLVRRAGGETSVKLLGGRGAWNEQIERWSLGRLDRGVLATGWTAFRTLKNRSLPLESPWLEGLEGAVCVEVVDVLGRTARILPSS